MFPHTWQWKAFLILTLLWLQACGVSEPVTFRTDWGEEFGGDNPERIVSLSERFLAGVPNLVDRRTP